MCGNEKSAVTVRGKEASRGSHTQDTRECFPVGEYTVPFLEEAYRDDFMRGSAYLEK